MAKKPRKLLLSATPIICLLVLPFLYADVFGSNFASYYQWMQRFSDQDGDFRSRGISKAVAEIEIVHSLDMVVEEPKNFSSPVDSSPVRRQVNTTVEDVQVLDSLNLEKRQTTTSRSKLGIKKREINGSVEVSESLEELLKQLLRGEDLMNLEAKGFGCDRAEFSVDCVASKPVRINTGTMTVYLPPDQTVPQTTTVVRPYARQEDKGLLETVSPVQILQGNTSPPACQYIHDVPAVIFSSSGFVGNLYHEFNEVIIPLFITTRHFKSRVRFIITDFKHSFARKYSKVLFNLSKYGIINPARDRNVHCFPGAVVGLKFHGHITVNPDDIPGGYSMPDFRKFLREAYNLQISNVSQIKTPRLLLISRLRTRKFLNEVEMIGMMEELGFEVVLVRKPDLMSNLSEFAGVINSCSVMVGVHGAGLTNEIFLPQGAVMVQVDPLGLEWGSAVYYGDPARAMGVHYLRYKIEPEESSLIDLYGPNHPVIVDPDSIHSKGYQVGRAEYLDKQSVKLNITRFRVTLLEALKLIGQSAPLSE